MYGGGTMPDDDAVDCPPFNELRIPEKPESELIKLINRSLAEIDPLTAGWADRFHLHTRTSADQFLPSW